MSSQHTDVAAYSLGLLEQQDRQEFEAHLAECASCAAELAEFSSMADLLTGIEPVESAQDEPAEAVVVDLVRRRAADRRRRVWRQSVLAAAASLVLLAGGVAAGVAAAPQQAAPAAALVPGEPHSAADPATGVTGKVGLVAKAWGTQVTLELANVRGPLECQLIAVSTTGARRIITGWFVPSAGYGVPGHPGTLIITGGTAIARNDLASVVVQVVHGGTLLTIPV
ncbi:MAG TPA: zf-HC2 domain-containing protein [Streptosporangiaceae bacterium]|nr:zf-HC2 domain-containing protein [Streptosporangiaceae bacterium]